jgi:hypothetical protein
MSHLTNPADFWFYKKDKHRSHFMNRAIQTTIAIAQRILDGGKADTKPRGHNGLMPCFAAVLDLLQERGRGDARIMALVSQTRETLKLCR